MSHLTLSPHDLPRRLLEGVSDGHPTLWAAAEWKFLQLLGDITGEGGGSIFIQSIMPSIIHICIYCVRCIYTYIASTPKIKHEKTRATFHGKEGGFMKIITWIFHGIAKSCRRPNAINHPQLRFMKLGRLFSMWDVK